MREGKSWVCGFVGCFPKETPAFAVGKKIGLKAMYVFVWRATFICILPSIPCLVWSTFHSRECLKQNISYHRPKSLSNEASGQVKFTPSNFVDLRILCKVIIRWLEQYKKLRALDFTMSLQSRQFSSCPQWEMLGLSWPSKAIKVLRQVVKAIIVLTGALVLKASHWGSKWMFETENSSGCHSAYHLIYCSSHQIMTCHLCW